MRLEWLTPLYMNLICEAGMAYSNLQEAYLLGWNGLLHFTGSLFVKLEWLTPLYMNLICEAGMAYSNLQEAYLLGWNGLLHFTGS